MSRIVEVALNGVLASVLQTKNPQWRDAVFAEHTRILRGSAAMRPDIVVRCPNGIPVVIETEYEPANTVELDAKNRLGKVLDEGGARVEAAVAIRIPEHLGEGAEPEKRIKTGEFRMCVFTGGYLDESTIARWPETGWLTGGIDVLADMLEQVSLSERIVSEGTQLIEYAVRDAAWQLRHNIQSGGFPSILLRIAETLCQEDSEQTIRMAMAIILNALIFHTAIAGEHEVKEPKEARGLGGYLSKSKMQECWEGILKINYWPIFKIAHDLLGCIPERYTRMYLVRLVETAEAVANIGATTLNDLSGIMFQRLINDRKFLATFYTLPSSATLRLNWQ